MIEPILPLIRRMPGAAQLVGRLRDLEARLQRAEAALSALPPSTLPASGPDSFPLQPWWERSFWEPTVALAIRDHCRPGDTVFDVGTNAGALAMMMSRLVGPSGVVLAFEASPRIIAKTHHNLVHAGCANVTLFHKAVWHTSGALVNIAAGSHLNDRIEVGATGMVARTIALDDLAEAGGFRPRFIKMDVEGAEFDALRGMPRLLQEARPVLVLEQSPQDLRCHALLTESSYAAIDLATYRRVHGAADFAPGTSVANVLFVSEESMTASPYFGEAPPVDVTALTAGDFARAPNGDIRLRTPLELPPGRYIVKAEFTAEGRNNEVFAGLEADGETVFRYHTSTAFMAESYTDWVIQLDRSARITPFLRFLTGADPTLRWTGARVRRLPAFDGWLPPVID